MEILYCFKLDPDTGEVKRYEIKDYHVKKRMWATPKEEICFKENLGTRTDYHYALKPNKLNRFVHEKVFTFDPDYGHAIGIIIDTLKQDVEESKLKFKRLEGILSRVRHE